jgi:hypothetical protein
MDDQDVEVHQNFQHHQPLLVEDFILFVHLIPDPMGALEKPVAEGPRLPGSVALVL